MEQQSSPSQWSQTHIDNILYESTKQPLVLPVCDHYAGTLSRLETMLLKQQEVNFPFDITADCEDGAIVGQEQFQIDMITKCLAHPLHQKNQKNGRRLGVRTHDAQHLFFEKEIRRFVSAEIVPDYLVLPKIRDISDLKQQIQLIEHEEKKGSHISEIHVVIETHGAIRDVFEIAAHPRVACLSFGIMDYVSSFLGTIPHSAMKTPGQFDHPLIQDAKVRISKAANTFGKIASHNVCVRLENPEFAFEDAYQAHHLFGFMRMWSIHPSQIEHIHKAFNILDNDLLLAQEIITKALSSSFGPIKHEHQLHDRASFRYHWTLIKRAKTQGLKLLPHISALFEKDISLN